MRYNPFRIYPSIPPIHYTLNQWIDTCHEAARAAGWWTDPNTGSPIERNKGELIALMHSELSEALEAIRKNTMDDKLPDRSGEEVELADLLIRVFDYAGHYGLDLAAAVQEKLRYNAAREDHDPERRRQAGGKAF